MLEYLYAAHTVAAKWDTDFIMKILVCSNFETTVFRLSLVARPSQYSQKLLF